MVFTDEEARRLQHDYIGTEHILLGLIREEDGVGARALQSFGVRLEAVRAQIEEIIGRGKNAPGGHIPFTPRGKKVLELALRESLQLDHNYIGTEHILLGLIREGEGVAAQILVKMGVDLAATRQKVIELLPSSEPPPRRLPKPSPPIANDATVRLQFADGIMPMRCTSVLSGLAWIYRPEPPPEEISQLQRLVATGQGQYGEVHTLGLWLGVAITGLDFGSAHPLCQLFVLMRESCRQARKEHEESTRTN